MKYNEAMAILRAFSSEPLDHAAVGIAKLAEIRRAIRTTLKVLDEYRPVLSKVLDANEDAVLIEVRLAESYRRQQPEVYAEPVESVPVRMVDLIRELTELKGYATEMELYKTFRKSIAQMKSAIGNSYGIVSMSQGKGEDGYNEYRFHFLAETGLEFNEKYDGKAPEGHTLVGPGW